MDMRLPLKLTEAIPMQDRFQRQLRELRVSVIDRCNFRCTYCMPADSLQGRGVFLPLEKLLTDHEMETMVRAFVDLGVRKLRITGGEPLLRPGLPALIEQLVTIPGIDDVALTTNGVLLPRLAQDLRGAGYIVADERDGYRGVARVKAAPTLDVVIVRADLGAAGTMIAFKLFLHPTLAWLAFGYVLELDPLWVSAGVIFAACPVGLNVYVMKGALGNLIPLTTIFRGVTWFIITDVITLAMIIAFPILSLYLPSLMK